MKKKKANRTYKVVSPLAFWHIDFEIDLLKHEGNQVYSLSGVRVKSPNTRYADHNGQIEGKGEDSSEKMSVQVIY